MEKQSKKARHDQWRAQKFEMGGGNLKPSQQGRYSEEQKKKVITSADILFCSRNQVNGNKKVYHVRKCPIICTDLADSHSKEMQPTGFAV